MSRNVRAANELMRAAAGQGQNRDGTTITNESSRAAVAMNLQGALMNRRDRGSALHVVSASSSRPAKRAPVSARSAVFQVQEAPALIAGSRRDAPPGC